MKSEWDDSNIEWKFQNRAPTDCPRNPVDNKYWKPEQIPSKLKKEMGLFFNSYTKFEVT